MKKAIIAILVLGMIPLCAHADLTASASKDIMKWYADRNGGKLPSKDAFRIAVSVDGVVSVVHWTAQMGPQPTDAVINSQSGETWWAARENDKASPNKGWDNLSHEMRFQLKVFYNFDKRLRVREGKPEITFPEFRELMRPVWNSTKPPE